jgi:hypothetical protein
MTLLHHIPYQAMVSENDQPSQIRIKLQTVVKSIRTLPIFPIYFI